MTIFSHIIAAEIALHSSDTKNRQCKYNAKCKIRFKNHNISSCKYVNYLGINLDQYLNFKPHISILAKKKAKSVGMLWKLRKFLPKKTLISLYHAFVQSYLLYGIVTWGPSVSSNTLNKLILLQNNSIRAIVGLKKSQHITSYRDLEILKIKNLCHFEIAKLMFIYPYSRLLIMFDNYFVTCAVCTLLYTITLPEVTIL